MLLVAWIIGIIGCAIIFCGTLVWIGKFGVYGTYTEQETYASYGSGIFTGIGFLTTIYVAPWINPRVFGGDPTEVSFAVFGVGVLISLLVRVMQE